MNKNENDTTNCYIETGYKGDLNSDSGTWKSSEVMDKN